MALQAMIILIAMNVPIPLLVLPVALTHGISIIENVLHLWHGV
jgi:hypothetical protein